MKKILLVIGLKTVEILGGIIGLVVMPIVIGKIIDSYDPSMYMNLWWAWLFGFMTLVVIFWVSWALYAIVRYAIPSWIRANRRWAARIMGEDKIYCHACSVEAEDKNPVHHYPPECKQKKKEEK